MGHPAIQEITLRNFLSFGPDTPPFEMKPLNVLIGPNASGKSNFLESIAVVRALPNANDLESIITGGGGVREWLWKGANNNRAEMAFVTANPKGRQPLRYVLEFEENANRFFIRDERIENRDSYPGHERPYFYYKYEGGRPVVTVADGYERHLEREDVAPDVSILAQRQDPEQYPEITYLGRQFSAFRLYREWAFGRRSPFRRHQPADLPNKTLSENFGNLGLYLNRLRRHPSVKQRVLSSLRDLYQGFDDFDVSIDPGGVQVFFQEAGLTEHVPATRLSDGTLRYLCLLAVLLNPEPPPIVCIEEPELGLHPDLLPKIADLMVEASERMQLVVTTHSDIIIDALTEHPESVVVCEKGEGGTEMKRLDPENLKIWLDDYRLGDLWMRGQIGGTRW